MSPEEAARMVLELHWDKRLPVDPVTICKNMGVGLFFDRDLVMSGLFELDGNNRPVIYINPNESRARQRFTAVHELGHYVMNHGPSPREPFNTSNARNYKPLEVEANRFAAEVIMPREAVIYYFNQGRDSLAELAARFAVSESAMAIRLERLGLV